LRGPREEEPHRIAAVDGMRAEEGKGIGVAGGKDGLDLRIEARIARSKRCHLLDSWALLRQVSGLPDVASQGSADKLSPNAEPRLLNSRAFAGKCQTICEGGVPARELQDQAPVDFVEMKPCQAGDLSLGHGIAMLAGVLPTG